MSTYCVTQEDQRLDAVVYNHYGSLENFSKILELNDHVIYDVFLEVGMEIKLPEFNTETIAVRRLWE